MGGDVGYYPKQAAAVSRSWPGDDREWRRMTAAFQGRGLASTRPRVRNEQTEH